jgi:hypothetical protein
MPVATVVIYKECSLAMAAPQLIENQQRSYEVFEKKHDMECTTVPIDPDKLERLTAYAVQVR